ncbi:MAG: hypothetical protein M1837_006952 [Sclerophora amabilis]|nr:MAG: hypothetical protein M1837_006952 [Sclerophora amabilis]
MSTPPAVGYVDPNFPNPNGPQDVSVIIYGHVGLLLYTPGREYTPSLAVGLLGVILFALSTIVHVYQLFRYRTWYFTPIIVGTIMEVVGYVFRICSSQLSPYNLIYFVIQYFFIVVAPVFFSAAIYTVLSMLINAVPNGPTLAPLAPRLILIIFIVCDVIATVVQVAGAALIGVAESNRRDPTTPNNILLAGLSFQVFSFFLFLVLFFTFLWRARKVVAATMMPFTFAFVFAALLVYLRTCFRLAETAEGLMQNLSTNEVYFGCLEFAPVIIAVGIFNGWHPGKWVTRYR